ncbi:MAG TPA: hypothetical protein PLT20_10260, partial [Sedimentisphaerales bacterium]|nr:hypothetical protein [Sedimentisphaerales bacterium]
MLEPRDRSLLFNALRPPAGYRLDCGIGTTYSLDLLALLTAPLAFTRFERSDESVEANEASLAVLESVRRYADKLTIFCHAGKIAVPRGRYPQFAYLEQSVIQCVLPHPGAFHPKVWLLRFVADNELARYRLLCLTRNLTFARSWDTVLALEGPLLDRKNALAANHPLGDFIAALPLLARSVSEAVRDRVTLLSDEVRRVQFELPEGFTGCRFWPLGIDGHREWPFQESGRRLLVVSPFVSLRCLEQLAETRDHATLVSTSRALAGLSRHPAGF